MDSFAAISIAVFAKSETMTRRSLFPKKMTRREVGSALFLERLAPSYLYAFGVLNREFSVYASLAIGNPPWPLVCLGNILTSYCLQNHRYFIILTVFILSKFAKEAWR